jgi:hypothetical protein
LYNETELQITAVYMYIHKKNCPAEQLLAFTQTFIHTESDIYTHSFNVVLLLTDSHAQFHI